VDTVYSLENLHQAYGSHASLLEHGPLAGARGADAPLAAPDEAAADPRTGRTGSRP
jgi:hypothetical protein